MNVIVSNKNQGLLSSLEIEVIKSINGEFTPEEIASTFSNFFFNRMFLDITAIKNYTDISNIQKLSISFDMDKVILLLEPILMADTNYLSKLISMGIYNFGQNKDALMYLYNHPNTYKDVAQYHKIDNEELSQNDKKNKFFGIKTNNNPTPIQNNSTQTAKVIGFRNITSGAGATTLIYMLKRILSSKDYTIAIEVNKNDFGFFNEKDMYSVNQNNLEAAINKFNNAKYILVDLNNCNEEPCDEIINLIEPSTIKLNKLTLVDKTIFSKLYGKKIVLNKSMLSEYDIKQFERESNTKVGFSIPPLNDREINNDILQLFISQMIETNL